MRTIPAWTALLFIMPMAGAQQVAPPPPPAAEHEHSSALDLAGATPGRAAWEPLPLLAGRREWLPLLQRALTQPDPMMRRRALFVLGQLHLRHAAPLARPALRDDDSLVRMQAGITLALLGDEAGRPGAVVGLREGPLWLRLYALQALWRLDTPTARQALATSRPTITEALRPAYDAALQHRPQPLRAGRDPNAGPAPRSLYDLWLTVADGFILESDFWWHKGDYEQCNRCHWTSLFFDATNVDAFTSIAYLQWSMGDSTGAELTYRMAIAANPNSWEAQQALGDFWIRLKFPNLALPYLQRAAKLGSPAVPRRRLGHLLERLGQPDEARQVWNDILELDPNDPIARRQLERMRVKGDTSL